MIATLNVLELQLCTSILIFGFVSNLLKMSNHNSSEISVESLVNTIETINDASYATKDYCKNFIDASLIFFFPDS